MTDLRAARIWLAVITGLYLLLGGAMSLIIPLAEAPDELDHFLYVRYLAQERAFPPLSPVASENPTMEANQPPLYYAILAAVVAGIDMSMAPEMPQNTCFSFDPADGGRQTFYMHTDAEAWPFQGVVLAFHLGRVVSLLLGALAVGLTYALTRRVVPAEPRAGLLAAALVAFNPQFIFISASVNNDVLAAVFGVAIVLLAVSNWREPRTITFAFLGLLIGLGLLTKAGLFALWPVAMLAAAAPLVRQLFAPRSSQRAWGAALRDSLPAIALVGGLPLLVGGWWYGRATLLYGDPLAWRVHLAAKGPFVLRDAPLRAADLVDFASLHFRSYWALFGWLNVQAPGWFYVLAALLVGTAVAGVIYCVYDCWRHRSTALRPGRDACFCDLPLLGLTALALLATYISLLRYIQTINWSGYQGRLAYAVIGPAAALLASGLAFLAQRAAQASKRGRFLAYALAGAGPLLLLFFALVSVLILLPAAYPHPAVFQPEGLQPMCARFEGGLLLDGYTAADRVEPGETLHVILSGYGMAGRPGSGNLTVMLRGAGDEVWGSAETAVSWSPGQTAHLALDLPVSAAAEPGRATLVAGLRGDSGEWQTARSAAGRDLDTPLVLQTLKIPQQALGAGNVQVPVDAVFDGGLRLLGYDLARDGQKVVVTLAWQALEPLQEDFVTFVHLLDARGELVAQEDSQPQNGAYPTAIWDPGEVVLDAKVFQPPPDVQGPLSLVAGAYRWPEGERLAVVGSQEDTVLLGTFASQAELRGEGKSP